MALQQKAFKFKLKPTTEQAAQINRTFGCTRFVFNRFLSRRGESYKAEKKSLGYNATSAELTVLKKELEWLGEVDKFALQNSLKDLDRGFANFFRDCKKSKKERKFGYPRFKSKHTAKNSYRTNLTNNNIAIEDDRIKLPKLGWVRFSKSQEITGKILNVTITQDSLGKYTVSIVCETEITPYPISAKTVGIDLGLKHFFTTSTGETLENPRHYRTTLKQLKRAGRILSRRTKGSSGYKQAKTKLAAIHARISNLRQDFLHKTSTRLIREYGFIGLETLRVANMVKNHRLAQSIMDVGWSEFVRQLEYKGVWHERIVQKISPFFASSQICSDCGFKNPAVKDLKIRVWTCPNCGETHDRDKNAGQNIELEALRTVAAGLSETLNAQGGRVRRSSPSAMAVELGIPSL
jgi:putative transposase